MLKNTDAANIDLKGITEEFYENVKIAKAQRKEAYSDVYQGAGMIFLKAAELINVKPKNC